MKTRAKLSETKLKCLNSGIAKRVTLTDINNAIKTVHSKSLKHKTVYIDELQDGYFAVSVDEKPVLAFKNPADAYNFIENY